uniref:hypothetical protein n=1 Tax=Marinobacterium profundum TaxID=1714300 RepID=UPI000A4724A0|nr:hypothetical protein [Marinobacterium profundum]
MSLAMQVPETELMDVLEWSEEHGRQHSTDHPEGTYEEGVNDALRWALGYIHTRPDEA